MTGATTATDSKQGTEPEVLATPSSRSRLLDGRIAPLLLLGLVLAIAAARVESAAASVTFPDGVTVKGDVTCPMSAWPAVRQYQLQFFAIPNYINPSPYTTTYARFRVINYYTGAVVVRKGWLGFLGMSNVWTIGPHADGTYLVQGFYGRYVNGVFYQSTAWESIRIIRYQAGVIARCWT